MASSPAGQPWLLLLYLTSVLPVLLGLCPGLPRPPACSRSTRTWHHQTPSGGHPPSRLEDEEAVSWSPWPVARPRWLSGCYKLTFWHLTALANRPMGSQSCKSLMSWVCWSSLVFSPYRAVRKHTYIACFCSLVSHFGHLLFQTLLMLVSCETILRLCRYLATRPIVTLL